LLVAAATLLAVVPASAQSLTVKLWSDRGDGAVYQPGDPIDISVRTNRDANLIVYEIDAEGAVHVLFPWEGNDTSIEGGTALDLPEDPSEQLVVEGPVGEGYIVAIASEEPFRRLPWYLRPHDERAEELGYTAEDHPDEGVTPDGKIVGDPFVAMERIRRQVLPNPSDTRSFATTYTSYYVHHAVRYPRYLCNDCHRPGYWGWWDGFDPYYSQCSVFEFRVNAGWWWGPTYWTTYVPYYAYVYRTNCPPRYRPRGPHGWFSSWDGWRRWTGTWGGPLRRYKSAPPPDYVGPSRWNQRQFTGGSRQLPPGYLASAHERPISGGVPGSGLRRERREGWAPSSGGSTGSGGSRPWIRDGGSRSPRDVPRGNDGQLERGRGSSGTPSERRWGRGDRPAPAPDGGRAPTWDRGGNRSDRPSSRTNVNDGNRSQAPRNDRSSESPRWSAPRSEPQPASPPPSRGDDRGGQRQERPRSSDPPRSSGSRPR
jgi:hypothetical protein